MAAKETRKSILDAAESLFAHEGYHNTSLRTITNKARANLAAVNYHFGSKEGLIKAVIERRLAPLNALRKKRLEEVRDAAAKSGNKPNARDVLQAFIEPTVLFRESSPGARACVLLIARALSEPDDTVRAIFMRLVLPVFHLWHEILSEALPQVPPDILYFRLHFTIGALAHTLHHDDKWPVEAEAGSPVFRIKGKELANTLVQYVTAGMEASP